MPQEIQTPDGGMGLDGLLRAAPSIVSGILNGIDDQVWDPATDPHARARPIDREASMRAPPTSAALQERFGLEAGSGRAAVRRGQPA